MTTGARQPRSQWYVRKGSAAEWTHIANTNTAPDTRTAVTIAGSVDANTAWEKRGSGDNTFTAINWTVNTASTDAVMLSGPTQYNGVRLTLFMHQAPTTEDLNRQPQEALDARAFKEKELGIEHGNRMGEIGAQGANALRVAQQRPDKMQGAARQYIFDRPILPGKGGQSDPSLSLSLTILRFPRRSKRDSSRQLPSLTLASAPARKQSGWPCGSWNAMTMVS